MRAVASVVAMAIALAATPGNAFDAAEADIIGLRLGMPDHEAVASMRSQGFAVTHDHGTLIARTRDGRLTVDLTDDQVVRQIRYTFAGKGVGERQKIQDAILDRFGAPNQAEPMTWCRAPESKRMCPDDGASLTFLPDTLTIVLRAGETPSR